MPGNSEAVAKENREGFVNIDEFREKLEAIEQQQLLEHWEQLTSREQKLLLAQIAEVDSLSFQQQRGKLLFRDQPHAVHYSPYKSYDRSGDQEDKWQGRALMAQGEVGCLIVAGGQGSRLGYEGPKGEYPVSVVEGKSLFQLTAERVVAASMRAGRPLPLAIMTSPQNHKQTVEFFDKHQRFGLSKSQLSIFMQGELPLLDRKGDLFLEERGKIAAAADGNGRAFKHFVQAGIWKRWKEQGVKILNFILIDNPLADPFDEELIGYHFRHRDDVTVKAIERDDPSEKVGIIIEQEGAIRVVEYTEIAESEAVAIDSSGQLKHRCANISLFCFNMDFVLEAAENLCGRLPLHPVLKAVKYLSANGDTIMADKPIAWKYETYIFDLLAYASTVHCLLYPRDECFAPLKSRADLSVVQAALQHYDRKVWQRVTGTVPPEKAFELPPAFYYPTEVFEEKWRGVESLENLDVKN